MTSPITRDVLLVGGGHSHALLIRRWAMNPIPGVRLTLVSDGVLTPYSGMLPGLVAGHYDADQVHIDLRRLCTLAGVRFINSRMTSLDVAQRAVRLSDRPALSYDVLSLDTGSTPDLSIDGAREYSTPVKPVHAFYDRWLAIRHRLLDTQSAKTVDVGVVGSGAGGFEIVVAMRHALPASRARVHWILRGDEPLAGRVRRVRRKALDVARAAGIVVHQNFDVVKVAGGPEVHARDGRQVTLDDLLWCTGAVGPAWVRDSGLKRDARGFVLTDGQLRSVSHPDVFATGDIGTQADTPSPKAGVYAVRQAPYLYENIKRLLLRQPLRTYRPQRDFLSLMATGPKEAIASRGPFMWTGAWVWRWKDRIDQAFMNRIAHLPPMSVRPLATQVADVLRAPMPGHQGSTGLPTGPQCKACGAKVGGDTLDNSLTQLDSAGEASNGIHIGLRSRSDTAVFETRGKAVVQSVDQLSTPVDDPWLFARIAVRHALADVLTQSAHPHSVQLILTLPPATDAVQQRELDLVMAGASSVLKEEGIALLGGHTATGPELQIGLVVNGLANLDSLLSAENCQPGDQLLLTRALGSGLLFAGAMRGLTRGQSLEASLAILQSSQTTAAKCLMQHGARIMTDVTGFGLIGHVHRMLSPCGLYARISFDRLPLYDGVWSLAESGVESSLFAKNLPAIERYAQVESAPWRRILADPQTAGGLLAVLPQERAEAALVAVRASCPDAELIGDLCDPKSAGQRHRFC